MEFAAPPDSGWIDVTDGSDVVPGAKFHVSSSSHPGWESEPVAIFALSSESSELEFYAISDPCPHVAVGSLHDGDACADLGDLEDIAGTGLRAAVLCPVHSFAFDLQTGHCITDKRQGTPPARIYRTRLITVAAESAGGSHSTSRMLQIHTEPKETTENTVSLKAGNKAQLHLVQLALERKYGVAADSDGED